MDADGAEIDWHVGYGPPAAKFVEKLDMSARGIDTYRALSAQYTENPDDVAVVFKLAEKYAGRYVEEKTLRALELHRKVIALDPEGKAGTTEYLGENVSYREASAYAAAQLQLFSRDRDITPMKAFIRDFPESPILKQAYSSLGSFYSYSGSREDATAFFEDYVARYGDDPSALNAYVTRIIRDKGPIDRGIELAEKIRKLTRINPVPAFAQNLAQLHILNDEKSKADEVYGRTFIEGRVTGLAWDLAGFANFWHDRDVNLDTALEMALTAIRLNPDHPYFLQTAAKLHIKTGNEAEALAVYGPRFASTCADKPNDLISYARFWSGRKTNLESALEAAEKAAELQPQAPHIQDTLAMVYLALDRKTEALEAAEKAAALAADQPGLADFYRQRLAAVKESIEKKDD